MFSSRRILIKYSRFVCVISLLFTATGYGISQTYRSDEPLLRGISDLTTLANTARMKSLTTGHNHCVQPVGPFRLVVKPEQDNNSEQKPNALAAAVSQIDLPLGVGMVDNRWSLCYGPNGMSEQEATIRFQNDRQELSEVKLLHGGASTIIRKL